MRGTNFGGALPYTEGPGYDPNYTSNDMLIQPFMVPPRARRETQRMYDEYVRGDVISNLSSRSKTHELQAKLFEVGAYPASTTPQTAITGKMDSRTKQAIKEANMLGYDVNTSNNTIKENPIKKLQVELFNKGFYGDKASKEKEIDGVVGARTNRAIAMAEGEGYRINRNDWTMKQYEDLALDPYPFTSYEDMIQRGGPVDRLILNQYPYGYSDTKPYNPEDYRNESEFNQSMLRAIHEPFTIPEEVAKLAGIPKAYDSAAQQFAHKGYSGAAGVYKPGVKAAYEFADLDLSDPANRPIADSLAGVIRREEPTWGIKGSGPYSQAALRGRIDQNLLHLGYQQRYGSYMINPDFTANGHEITRVHSNPRIRNQERAFAKRFMEENPYHYTEDGRHRVYEVPGGSPYAQHGRYTIVTDRDGSNARYHDIWDFIISNDLPGTDIISVGDYVYNDNEISPQERRIREEIEAKKGGR